MAQLKTAAFLLIALLVSGTIQQVENPEKNTSLLNSNIQPNSTFAPEPAVEAEEETCNELSRNKDPKFLVLANVSCLFVTTVVGTVANSLVILALVLNPILRNKVNVYLKMLLVCDLILCSYVIPSHMIRWYQGCWMYSMVACRVLTTIDFTTWYSSLHIIALLSYDKYKMVKLGANYAMEETKTKQVIKLLIVLVVFTAVPSLVGVFWDKLVSGVSINGNGVCTAEYFQSLAYTIYHSYADVWVTIGITIFCSVQVISYLRRKKVRVGRQARNMTMEQVGLVEKKDDCEGGGW